MRKILFLLIILNALVLTACVPTDDGVTPTHDFSINEYYQDNCIILHNENFIINGESEPGVLLTAELFNELDKKVEHTSCIADIDGKFTLTLSAPSASYQSYRLVINDSVNEKEIKNIKFGEIWIFAGEGVAEYNSDYDSECDSVSFYTFNEGKYSWKNNIDDLNNNYIEYFAKQLSEKIDKPVGIIDATLSEGHADAWLSFEVANKYLRVQNYLKEINRYSDDDKNIILKSDNLSSMYNTFIEPLKNINIRGFIWNQGNSEISEDFDKVAQDYSYLLMILFSELEAFFNNDIMIFSIQENSFGNRNFDLLRTAQSIPTFQVKNVNLIPTYDCYEVDEEIKLDHDSFNERIINTITNDVYQSKNDYTAISYNNIVVNANTYEIIFEKQLLEIEELNGLLICDEFHNPLTYEFDIDDNKLIISLLEEDVQAKYIYFGYNNNIYENNLKTATGIPIIPFFIELDVESARK